MNLTDLQSITNYFFSLFSYYPPKFFLFFPHPLRHVNRVPLHCDVCLNVMNRSSTWGAPVVCSAAHIALQQGGQYLVIVVEGFIVVLGDQLLDLVHVQITDPVVEVSHPQHHTEDRQRETHTYRSSPTDGQGRDGECIAES